MSAWKKVTTNSNLIQHETDKACLIKLPKSNLLFWHPLKCVRTSGKNSYHLSISYTDAFTFKVFTPGKGKHNRAEKFNEQELTVEQFEKYFVGTA